MNCKNCGAPMQLVQDRDYFRCDHCGSFYFPDASAEGVRVVGEPADINCPVCQTPLVSASVEASQILYCNNCRGVLVRQSDLYGTIQRLRARFAGRTVEPLPLNPEDLKRRLRCPRCHLVMDTHPYGGGGKAVIDTCGRCAIVWLDYGELSKIAHAPEYGDMDS